mmetsp:Transcript_21885/g.21610  ORF Transcript_21885/g.21610 Transcript_21885/m.21610 type:complete len:119 (+) Transcript_21885:5-361(+)
MATLFEKVGGHAAIVALVDRLYEKILANPVTAAAFVGRDAAEVKRLQVELFSNVMGSGTPYTGRPLVQIHTGLHIAEEQFGLVAQFLQESMNELGVAAEHSEAVMKWAASKHGEVVGL